MESTFRVMLRKLGVPRRDVLRLSLIGIRSYQDFMDVKWQDVPRLWDRIKTKKGKYVDRVQALRYWLDDEPNGWQLWHGPDDFLYHYFRTCTHITTVGCMKKARDKPDDIDRRKAAMTYEQRLYKSRIYEYARFHWEWFGYPRRERESFEGTDGVAHVPRDLQHIAARRATSAEQEVGRPAPLVAHLDERLVQATLSDVLVPTPGEANRIEGEEHAPKDKDAQYWDRFFTPKPEDGHEYEGTCSEEELGSDTEEEVERSKRRLIKRENRKCRRGNEMRNRRDMWNVPPLGESDPDETERTSAASGSESDSEDGSVTNDPDQKRARTE